jgi:16S rRNA (cytidine1402-2'-O)-methyltransferase
VSNQPATLYIVATPLGNLEDFSARAARVLREAALIAAEDTRTSHTLLRHYGIDAPVVSLHEHNERERVAELIGLLQGGQSIALVSDAGTPLLSDPGYLLVRAAHAHGIRVVPIPGPCAAIAALSAAGLPSDRFLFEGFPPPKHAARLSYFERLRDEPRTLIFYESPHRILDCVTDLATAFGPEREAVVARELTKQYETIRGGQLGELLTWIRADVNQQRGEFVLLVHGAAPQPGGAISAETQQWLRLLLEELPVSRAAAVVARISGVPKAELYDLALKLKGET